MDSRVLILGWLAGFMIAIGIGVWGHLSFLRSLAAHEPELWHAYLRIRLKPKSWALKRVLLQRQVYRRMTNLSVLRAYRRATTARRVAVALAIILYAGPVIAMIVAALSILNPG